MNIKKKQPAKPSYFFHGGFVDLGNVIKGVFQKCGEVISRAAEGLAEGWGKFIDSWGEGFWSVVIGIPLFVFRFSFNLVWLISSAIVTPVVCFSLTVFQIIMLLGFFILQMLYFGFISLLDRIFLLVKAIASHCPNCQEKFINPSYVCPSCGAEHTRLRPGYYGILFRECNCGKKLPTTFLNGRQKLTAKCPHCNYNIKDGGLQASWSIPVIGGRSSGKTCYINMTMKTLQEKAGSLGMEFTHDQNERDEFEQNLSFLKSGRPPAQTTDQRLIYYQFSFTPKGATKQQISLCDVAGELFMAEVGGNVINQQGFRYGNAFMMIIDPLSIPSYRNELAGKTNLNAFKGSPQPIDEMLDRFTRTLQNMFKIDAKAMLKTDVAVVFTKADLPGLNEKIGVPAVKKIAPSTDKKTLLNTQNELCEKFLIQYDENNFLKSLKSRFRGVQFFVCSALGHVENGQPFIATGVEEPLFWLLKKMSNVLDRALP